MKSVLAGLAAAILVAGPLAAQETRSEQSTTQINNSLVRQGQNRDAAQQNQFEINSLRNQPARTAAPPVVVAPPIAGPAPAIR